MSFRNGVTALRTEHVFAANHCNDAGRRDYGSINALRRFSYRQGPALTELRALGEKIITPGRKELYDKVAVTTAVPACRPGSHAQACALPWR
jgi:hypothetical protein